MEILRLKHSRGETRVSSKNSFSYGQLAIVDSNILELYKDSEFIKSLVCSGRVLPMVCNEKTKNMDSVNLILEEFLKRDIKRDSVVIGVGGGSLQDIVGYACSIYHRGVPWRFIPTTLASMVDSCIGGKTSLNMMVNGDLIKNKLGTFHPPEEVILLTENDSYGYGNLLFRETWSRNHKLDAYGEMIHLMMADENLPKLLRFLNFIKTNQVNHRWIEESLKCKVKFIEEDEFDKGKRLLLNLGHTFGHALESTCGLSHGKAVMVGCVIASNLTSDQRYGNFIHEIIHPLLHEFRHEYTIKPDEMIEAMSKDKKNYSEEYLTVIKNQDGKVSLTKLKREFIKERLEEYNARFR